MKKIVLFLIAVFLMVLSAFAADDQAETLKLTLTLKNCYQLALNKSELIGIDAEKIKEAEARFLQAFSDILPQVSFSVSESRQKTSMPAYKRSYEHKFVFKQTLFSGFKEFIAMSGSKLEQNQRVSEKERAKQLLFTDVSDAFYLLIEVRQDLDVLYSIRKVLMKRLDELKERERLGRSRKSELVSTQFQITGIDAELETVKNQENIASQLLEFLIGMPLEEIVDLENNIPRLRPEIEYIAKAAARPDLSASQNALEISKKNISLAKSDYFPEVSVEGDYYTHRSTSPQDSDWGTILKVDLPIFEGVATRGAVREAQAKSRESELELKLLNRNVVQEVRNAYANCQSAINRYKILKKGLMAAQMNYYLIRKDYQRSLVNNLEVLTAIQSLENSRRDFVQSQYETKRLYWQLRVAAGDITEELK